LPALTPIYKLDAKKGDLNADTRERFEMRG
jgi:hypothetical protein